MTTTDPRYAALFCTSDDAEAAASLDTDLEAARQAASLLTGPDMMLAASALLAASAIKLKAGAQPWTLLDAANDLICDLRREHGCEEWTEVADWTPQACAVEFLWAQERMLREGCRALRDRATTERETLAKAGLARAGPGGPATPSAWQPHRCPLAFFAGPPGRAPCAAWRFPT